MYKVVSMVHEIVPSNLVYKKFGALLCLPNDILQHILNFCSLQSISRFSRVSSDCRMLTDKVVLPESIPFLLASFPQNLPIPLTICNKLNKSFFLTNSSQNRFFIDPEEYSTYYLNENLTSIFNRYDLVFDGTDGLSKAAIMEIANELVNLIDSFEDQLKCTRDIISVYNEALS